jgi:hypothetical protein
MISKNQYSQFHQYWADSHYLMLVRVLRGLLSEEAADVSVNRMSCVIVTDMVAVAGIMVSLHWSVQKFVS